MIFTGFAGMAGLISFFAMKQSGHSPLSITSCRLVVNRFPQTSQVFVTGLFWFGYNVFHSFIFFLFLLLKK